MASKGKIELKFERCKGCYLCAAICPKNVLGPGNVMNEKGYYPPEIKNGDACIACGNCYTVCPDLALEIYKVTDNASPAVEREFVTV